MTYTPQHFEPWELVPPSVWNARGMLSSELMDPRILRTADDLRNVFGKTIINDWYWGGNYKESGFRTPETATGARFSQHRMGRAIDCKFEDVTVQEAYQYILDHPEKFPELTCLENIEATPTWLHADCRNCERIKVVNP